ncbi:anthocyanidin 3-O-glucosyltransferase 7-like [Tasmannia lanceolata]|uniref:anthocyanidin 3-O-glucosyltransferase 7-like n=1 Tax=Tasmannia lanceolata TaxID=3420 RepID=UPI004064821D
MLKTPHVAVFAFPFGSHAAPLLSLVRKLAGSAPGIHFSFFSTAESNASLAPIVASDKTTLENVRLYDISDGVPEGYVFQGRPQESIELFLNAVPGNFREGMERVTKEKEITCILSDSFLWFAGVTAEEKGVPWVSLWTAGACSLSAHFYTEHIRRTIGTAPDLIPAKQDEPLDFIPGLSQLRVRDLPEGIVFGKLDSPLSLLLHRMGEQAPRATAVAFNTVDGLERNVLDDLNAKFRKCLPVGPLVLAAPLPSEPDPHGCIAWLDRQNTASTAYVSFGSILSPPPAELAALAEGLEASGAPFILSMREGMLTHLPIGFVERTKERGFVVTWAPQTRVLGHVAVGAFITHCGWNSVIESIMCEVPMISRPIFGDQRLNARMISHVWEIGVGVEGGVLTKEGVVGVLDLVLSKEEGRKMREKFGGIKEVVISAFSKEGTSTKNIATLVEIISGNEKM